MSTEGKPKIVVNRGWGIFWVLIVCVTAGIALPYVNVNKSFTPEQLMVFRGFVAATLVFTWTKLSKHWGGTGTFGEIDKWAVLIGALLPLATLGLFQGIRCWGAGPTITVVAATPLINIVFSLFQKRRIIPESVFGALLMLGGVWLICQFVNKKDEFDWKMGLFWSVFGTLVNGVLYELFAKSKTSSEGQCFYGCLGMGMLGLVISLHQYSPPWPSEITDFKMILQLVLFGVIGGWVYWLAQVKTCKHLPQVEASTLLQSETLFVIIGASIILGERMHGMQYIGSVVVIAGTVIIARGLGKQPVWRLRGVSRHSDGRVAREWWGGSATTKEFAVKIAENQVCCHGDPWSLLLGPSEMEVVGPDGSVETVKRRCV